MKTHRIACRLLLWVILCCTAGSTATADAAPEPVKVTYRLKWLINASTAGDIFAHSQGFFAGQRLDVTVKAGGPERDAIRELELGYAQFGVASADQVIRALAKGAAVVVVAQLFQTNPLQWIYRADDVTIQRIQDLAHRKVGITFGGNDETIMRALLATAGMTEDQVQLTGVRYDYTPFYRKQVPIWPIYRNTQGVFLSDQLAAAGERAAFLDPTAHGIHFVANSVVTSQKMRERQPQTVERFVRALLAGWQAAMAPENSNAVIRALGQHDRDTSEAVLNRQLAVTRQMIQPDPTVPIGRIDTAAWRQTEQIMLRQALIPGPVNVVERLAPPGVP